MRFLIECKEEEREKVKEIAKAFCDLCEKEKKNVLSEKLKWMGKTFGGKIVAKRLEKLLPRTYFEEQDGKIYIVTTWSIPSSFIFSPHKKRLVSKMEKNLEGFFREMGVEIKAKYCD